MSEYHPSLEEEEVTNDESTAASLDTSSSNHSTTHEKKIFVFESCLDQVIRRCPTCCKAILNTRKFVVGSCLSVITECCAARPHLQMGFTNRYKRHGFWQSSYVSVNIIFWQFYEKICYLSELLNLQILSRSEFYRIQDAFLFSVVAEALENSSRNSICSDGRKFSESVWRRTL